MINKELLQGYRPDVSDKQAEQFDIYADTLVQWNEKMNLTGITEPDEIVIKHFVDSLMLLDYCEIPQGASVIDVGTGAGFPGIPLLIARNDIQLTLMDSLQKRLTFLDEVLKQTNLTAQTLHGRAEELGNDSALRESFDFATARAVAPLNILCEYCMPFVKVGGYFVALKGSSDEIDDALNAIAQLGGELVSNTAYKLPNDDGRSIVIIKKISQTLTKYPRRSKKIQNSPL